MSAPMTRPTLREPVESHATPGDWRHRAACRAVDPEVFFPVPVEGLAFRTRVAVAKAVCAGCPVREACLTWALAHQPDGIAGGMTEHERRAENRRRRRHTVSAPRPVPLNRARCGSASEVAEAGRAALAAGAAPRDVADELGVSERTALRWARAIRTTTTRCGESGGNRTPHGSPTQTPRQGHERKDTEGR